MTKPLDASDYLDDPEKAIALLNAVMASGQSLAVIEQALLIVGRALEKAGFQRPDVRVRDDPD